MESLENYDVVIVGAGLTGAVFAERFANKLNKRVIVLDKRPHVGGNCYDYIHSETGIRVSKYGPHFFHTNDEGVWKYINKFGEWIRYDLKIISNVDGALVPIPVNMETINILTNAHLRTENETTEWLKNAQIPCESPKNSEEIALRQVGKELYDKLFKPYTTKQWNCPPAELDQSVLGRIPVRYNTDCRYFDDKYQVIPKNGYSKFFKNMFNHTNITVLLNQQIVLPVNHPCVIFTGPIDSYFKDSGLPPLEYRSLRFEEEIYLNTGFFQKNVIINTPSSDIPYTRTTEYKHINYPEHTNTPHTVIYREYPSDTGEPYYPIPSPKNQQLYNKYKELADESSKSGVHMVGRLANYKYFNMDQAIRNALDYFNNNFM